MEQMMGYMPLKQKANNYILLTIYLEKDARLIPLSNRRYSQIDTIPEINMIVSRSGKYDVVSLHDLTTMTQVKKRSRFETETKLKKLKETRDCSFYTISKIRKYN